MVQNGSQKHLPLPTGIYVPGCVDVMTEYSKDGLFARIYYPTELNKSGDHSKRWLSWLPHQMYIIGFAYILNLWTFIIRLLVKYVAGDIKIPVVENENVNKKIGLLKTIVFSHGLGGTRFLYSCICCELASRGYVVIALEHRDDTASMTYFYESKEKRKRNEPTWCKFRRVSVGKPEHFPERKKQVERRADECRRALNLLEDLHVGKEIENVLEPDFNLNQFKDLLDLSEPIMMGHSFGGATSLLTLATDPRFKVGVILDPWMFSIRSHQNLPEDIKQPMIVINTQTFHIPANLKDLEKYTSKEDCETFTIKHTTHENQSDTVHVIGYWLNMFMRKMDPVVATKINNQLILRFLDKHVGMCDKPAAQEYLNKYIEDVVEDISINGINNTPKKIPRIW